MLMPRSTTGPWWCPDNTMSRATVAPWEKPTTTRVLRPAPRPDGTWRGWTRLRTPARQPCRAASWPPGEHRRAPDQPSRGRTSGPRWLRQGGGGPIGPHPAVPRSEAPRTPSWLPPNGGLPFRLWRVARLRLRAACAYQPHGGPELDPVAGLVLLHRLHQRQQSRAAAGLVEVGDQPAQLAEDEVVG